MSFLERTEAEIIRGEISSLEAEEQAQLEQWFREGVPAPMVLSPRLSRGNRGQDSASTSAQDDNG